MEPRTPTSTSPAIPIAIVIGFALIAVAIFLTGSREISTPKTTIAPTDTEAPIVTDGPRPVDETDFIRGNPNAPIVMIEYSDYDFPFCKQFHETMVQIMEEYGVEGRVAWVYRQFPIAQLHPNAPKIAEAALCVGELGGQSAFWSFSDLIFEQRELTEPTNMVRLPDYAERAGVDRAAYVSCVDSGRMKEAVEASTKDAFDLGARGTPYTVLIAGNQQAVINGAQSYQTVRSIVSNLIDQLDGRFDPAAATPTTPDTE